MKQKEIYKGGTVQYGKSYIVNLESTVDPETGKENDGSHYVCFQCNKYPSGEKWIYFETFFQGKTLEKIQVGF